jgi:hypothetical protein
MRMGPLANIDAIELSVPYVITRKVDLAIAETTYCPLTRVHARDSSGHGGDILLLSDVGQLTTVAPCVGGRRSKMSHNGTCMMRALAHHLTGYLI